MYELRLQTSASTRGQYTISVWQDPFIILVPFICFGIHHVMLEQQYIANLFCLSGSLSA